ncbi:MAG: N-acetylneuraminate synthase family protein [Alphaproteobacteria bacterium]
MHLFGKDLTRDVAIVAEVGVNHEGDVDVAARLVQAAARAGADAVKFQSYTPERFIAASDRERFERVSRFALDEAAHRRLARVASDAGIAFFSAAITEDWVPLLAEIGCAIKVASGDLVFEPVIRAAARSGRPVVLSTGAGTMAEVEQAVRWVGEEVPGGDIAERLALLHCVSAYPAPIEEVNLLSIPFMADRFRVTVGWSNHVIGPDACLAAVALGARIIEVHVTDRKEGRTFRDHALSFEPLELADLVARVRRLRAGLGLPTKEPAPSEAPLRAAIRKGVVAARDLGAGTILTADDLMFARPAAEFAAGEVALILGKTLARPLAKGAAVPRDSIVAR